MDEYIMYRRRANNKRGVMFARKAAGEMSFKPKNIKRLRAAAGIFSGLLNGLFGSGGGVVAVLFLRRILSNERKAHASATLMILLMSTVSLILYAGEGFVDWKQGLVFVPGGLLGAAVGSAFLKNIKTDKLRRVFGAVLALSGAVMLFS
ncbi:MAG: sulfite exporter TauE/SafE family protein [Oscillospiraceae bacterium]